jgi:transcription elongation factor GreA
MTMNDDTARLQGELEHLRDVEMPRLREALSDSDRRDPADLAQRAEWDLELESLIRRVDALTRILKPPYGRSEPHGAARVGDVIVLDLGDGARPYFLSEEPVGAGEDVITAHSPLGRAIIGATAGSRIRYRTPRGPAEAVVVEFGGAVPPAA